MQKILKEEQEAAQKLIAKEEQEQEGRKNRKVIRPYSLFILPTFPDVSLAQKT